MKEKDFFTQQRKENLDNCPDLSQTEKWGNYCLVPLDIPRFENPRLVDWFFQNSAATYKISPDVANSRTGVTAFDAIDVLPTNDTSQDDIWTLNVRQDFMTEFKDVYDQIMTVFPFRSISRIRLWSSTKNVMFHRDHTKFVDFPGAFRILLYDENPRQTLSLIQSLPDHSDNLTEKFPIPRLESTNCYAWNNLRTKHGSVYVSGFRKIIIILDRYDLDINKYQDLMIRSEERFKENIMISKYGFGDFINT